MAIRQDRYVAADTNKIKKVDIIEVPQIPDDPVLRRSDVQQRVNNSTLPVSSRAVNLAIESINSDLDLKADRSELEGLATEDYVNEKIDEKEIGITEPELISKSVGSGKWMREGAYGLGGTATSLSDEDYIGHLGGGGNYTNIRSFRTPNVGFEIRNFYTRDDRLEFRRYRSAEGGWQPSCYIYTEANTGIDSNGVLHNTKTPINTLNTSDMADTVVDNDLLTVTSGAVFRAIKQLTDQITSLETRVRELEDGGV